MTRISGSQCDSDDESLRFEDESWIRKWFDPDRYDDSDKLDASGWMGAILIRREIKCFGEDPTFWESGLSLNQSETFERSVAHLYGACDEPWNLSPEMLDNWGTSEDIFKILGFDVDRYNSKALVLRALCLLLADPLPQPLFSHPYGGPPRGRSDDEAGVFDLTLREYEEKFRKMVDNPALEDLRRLRARSNEGPIEIMKEYMKFLEQDATEFWRSRNVRMDFETVGVDLFATDEEIVADLKLWLKKKRKRLGIESRRSSYSQKKFTRLRNMGVLPYIDLTLVKLFCKKSISAQMIGDLLFTSERVERFSIKDHVERPYRVRTTVKNHADALMTPGKDSGFSALCAQAVRGHDSRNVEKKRKNKSRD